MSAEAVAGTVVALAGGGGALFALHTLTLSAAALRPASRRPAPPPRTPVTVLVPAHDEAALVARCVRSLRAQDYPADLLEVVVVADNCRDDTAAIAAAAGARVLVRDVPGARGKGQALRWALDRLLGEGDAPAAVAVVDADSVAGPGFLAALVAPLEAGAEAVQGESLLWGDGSTQTGLRVAAMLLNNRVRPAGRAALGRPAFLTGNGMLFTRELLRSRPWTAFTSAEDLEYSLALHHAGVPIAFARGAVLHSPAAPSAAAAAEQQLRWEGGKAHLARRWLGPLLTTAVRERRPGLLATALDLATPPLGALAVGVLGGTAGAGALVLAGLAPGWALASWLAADGALALGVLVGLPAGRAPASSYRALAGTPLFLLRKLRHLRRVAGFSGDTWVRTERAPAAEGGPGKPGAGA